MNGLFSHLKGCIFLLCGSILPEASIGTIEKIARRM